MNGDFSVIQDNIVMREERFPLNADIRLLNDRHDLAEMTIIDLSRAGLGMDGLVHFAPETRVRIEFPNGQVRTGVTRWRDTFTSGIAFDTPLSDGQLCTLWIALRNQPVFPLKAQGISASAA